MSDVLIVFFVYFAIYFIICLVGDMIDDNDISHTYNAFISICFSVILTFIFWIAQPSTKNCVSTDEKSLVLHDGKCYIKLTEGYIPAGTVIKKSLED